MLSPGLISKLSNEHFRKLHSEAPPSARALLVRLRAAGDPEFFARRFLTAYTRLPFAEFHRDLFRWHMAMAAEPLASRTGMRIAIAAPRGSAKSTIVSLILALHDLVFERESFIVLISATERQAALRLRALRSELESGEVARLISQPIQSNARALVFPNARIESWGGGSEMRGISERAWRPSKIILDDAESSAVTNSASRRRRLHEWFGEVAEHLGDRFTHILAIGTVLHPQGLLPTLIGRPDFRGVLLRSVETWPEPTPLWDAWRAILTNPAEEDRRALARKFFVDHRTEMERGSRVLWPAKEDIEELSAQLLMQGRRAFHQEKQNTPLGPEDAVFDADAALRGIVRGADLVIGRGEGNAFAESRRIKGISRAQRFAFLDAAMGKGRARGTGDFSALAVVMLAADGTLFLERIEARRIPPSEQVARLFDRHEATPFTRLAIEATGFQELLLLPIEEERKRRRAAGLRSDMPVETVHPKLRKEARIAALEPLLASGLLVLSPSLDEEFWIELARFPRTEHDDALDAAAGAVELARGHGAGGGASAEGVGTRRPIARY